MKKYVTHGDDFRRKAEAYDKAERLRQQRTHPKLNLVCGEMLRLGDLKRCLKSSHVHKVLIEVISVFGEEPVQIQVQKKAVLDAIGDDPARDESPSEFVLQDFDTLILITT